MGVTVGWVRLYEPLPRLGCARRLGGPSPGNPRIPKWAATTCKRGPSHKWLACGGGGSAMRRSRRKRIVAHVRTYVPCVGRRPRRVCTRAASRAQLHSASIQCCCCRRSCSGDACLHKCTPEKRHSQHGEGGYYIGGPCCKCNLDGGVRFHPGLVDAEDLAREVLLVVDPARLPPPERPDEAMLRDRASSRVERQRSVVGASAVGCVQPEVAVTKPVKTFPNSLPAPATCR